LNSLCVGPRSFRARTDPLTTDELDADALVLAHLALVAVALARLARQVKEGAAAAQAPAHEPYRVGPPRARRRARGGDDDHRRRRGRLLEQGADAAPELLGRAGCAAR
jgi:hypothetical protein